MVSEDRKTVILVEGGRLDSALAASLGISRSKAKELVENGVEIDGHAIDKASAKGMAGQVVSYTPLKEETSGIVPNPNIKVEIVYEDHDLMVLNKPRGLVVHMAPGHTEDTLVNYLVSLKDEFEFDAEEMAGGRPGIVHRLDKDTSGLLLVAKTPKAERSLEAQIKVHAVDREYLAICYGDVNEDRFTVDVPLKKPNHTQHRALPDPKGLPAITHFEKVWFANGVSLVKCKLETGRTHQIRAHLAYIGHPIVGDMLYGDRKDRRFDRGQLLHAYRITFTHPITGKTMAFSVPADAYFQSALDVFAPTAK